MQVDRVVVIGASAGGLEAVSSLVQGLSPGLPFAYVLAFHLSANHVSMMGEILSRRTSLAVETVSKRTRLRSGTLYVLEPGSVLTLDAEELMPSAAATTTPPSVVDALFVSAAEAWGPRAVGVVLSGTGRDGSGGAAALRERGAEVYCQSPAEAKFSGMPQTVLKAGLATYVGTAEELALRLAAELEHPVGTDPPDLPSAEAPVFWKLVDVLRGEMDIDLFSYRIPTLYRRVAQRAQTTSHPSLESYVAAALADPEERGHLARRVLVGTTEFFRDRELFQSLRRFVVPELLERDTVRIWSAGCSTGEEAYSVAALVDRELHTAGSDAQLRVFATDVRRDALAVAAKGRYTDRQLESFPHELRGAYFEPVDNRWQVRDALRKKVLFTVHDILRDPPFTNIDLVLFRNVLIYLRADASAVALSRLHFALKEQGVLALGGGESGDILGDGFSVVAGSPVPMARKVGPSARPHAFTFRPATVRAERRPSAVVESIGVLATRKFMALAGPPAVVVDASGDIVHVLKDPNPYLRLSDGPMSTRAELLAPGKLGGVIAAGLARVRRGRQPVSLVSGPLGELEPVRVLSIPLEDRLDHTLLAFQPIVRGEAASEDVTSLHEALADTRRNLEESLVDLRLANEELESANEELLATNEELEATNEELQATNEELFSVNAEREARLAELSALQDDVETMFSLTEIGWLFLYERLRIVRVLGDVSSVVPIGVVDLGRDLASFRSYVPDLDLAVIARSVLETGKVQRFSLSLAEGERAMLQVRRIETRHTPAKVVLLFVD